MENFEMGKEMLEDIENDPILINLVEYLRCNQPSMQILNVKRYYEMLIAKEALDDLLRQSWCAQKSTIKFRPDFACAVLSVEVDSFELTDKDAFMILLSQADNFEAVPLLNGKLRLSFMFYRMMKAVS